MTDAADLAPSYDLVVIGGGPAGLAAASLAARAGLATVLFDENPGVGGQIYRGITSTPVTDRAILGEDYWAGAALAAEAKASGAVDRQRRHGVEPRPAAHRRRLDRRPGAHDRGAARHHRHRLAGAAVSDSRLDPARRDDGGGAQTALKAQGLVPGGRTVMAGTGPLLWLLAAQILRAGGRIEAILDTTPRRNWLRALLHLPDFVLSPYFAKGLRLLREVRAKGSGHPRRQGRGASARTSSARSCSACAARSAA